MPPTVFSVVSKLVDDLTPQLNKMAAQMTKVEDAGKDVQRGFDSASRGSKEFGDSVDQTLLSLVRMERQLAEYELELQATKTHQMALSRALQGAKKEFADSGGASAQAAAKINQLEQELNQADRAVLKATQSLNKYEAEVKQAKQAASNFAGGLASMGQLAQVGMAALAGNSLLRFTGALFEAGASTDRMRTALEGLSGGQADTYIQAVSNASLGTINNFEAMKASALALKFGIASTPEDMARMTEAALVLGRATGRDGVEALNDYITAAGRQSVMIADNLGIMIKQSSLQDEVNQLMQENSGMTLAQAKAQAFANEMYRQATPLIEQQGGVTNDAASEVERFNAWIENTKASTGEWLATGLLPWIEGTRALNKAMQEVRQNEQMDLALMSDSDFDAYAKTLPALSQAWVLAQRAAGEMDLLNQQYGGVRSEAERYSLGLVDQTAAQDGAAESTQRLYETQDELAAALVSGTIDVQEYRDGMEGLKTESQQASDILREHEEAIRRVGEANLTALDSVTELGGGFMSQADISNQMLSDLQSMGLGYQDLYEAQIQMGLANGTLTEEQAAASQILAEGLQIVEDMAAAGLDTSDALSTLAEMYTQVNEGADLSELEGTLESLQATSMLEDIPAQFEDLAGAFLPVQDAAGLTESSIAAIADSPPLVTGAVDEMAKKVPEKMSGVQRGAGDITSEFGSAAGKVQALRTQILALNSISGVNVNVNVTGMAVTGGGGSFMVYGPQLILVGDNPSGMERVDITPIGARGQTYVPSNANMTPIPPGAETPVFAGGGTLFVSSGGSGGSSVTNNTYITLETPIAEENAVSELYELIQQEQERRGER